MFGTSKPTLTVPNLSSVQKTLAALTEKEYVEANLIPAVLVGGLSYLLASQLLDNKTYDQVGDVVEQIVTGASVGIISDVMGQSTVGQLTSIGLPAIAGIGGIIREKIITADTTVPTQASADSIMYAKLAVAGCVALMVYVKPLGEIQSAA
jgi:hypothetical protein